MKREFSRIISQRKASNSCIKCARWYVTSGSTYCLKYYKKFDIPAFVLADTTWGTCDLNSNGAKVLGAEILFNIGHTNKLETFPGEIKIMS